MKRVTNIVLAVGLLSVFTSQSFAAKSGYYLGFGVGASRIDSPNQNLVEGPYGYKTNRNLGGFGGRVFTGYNWNSFLGLEMGALRYAESKYSASDADGSFNLTYHTNAIDLVGKLYLPLPGQGFNLYGLAGAARVTATQKASLTGKDISSDYDVSISQSTTSIRPIYGLGISYDGTSNVSTSLEFSQIKGTGKNTNMPNANMLTLNVYYNLG